MDKTEVEALRVEIAALYYAWGEGMKPPPVEWARGNIIHSRAAVHSGDCTKESHTCSRCLADDALAFADAVLALTPPPAGDTGEAAAQKDFDALVREYVALSDIRKARE